MGYFEALGKFFGSAAGSTFNETINGIGDAAVKFREAIIGDLPPDKKAELEERYAELEGAIKGAQAKIIIAEAQGKSWIQRNWRPLLMVTIVTIIANNYLLAPYLSIWTDKVKVLELPERLWGLMEIGVGGYIASRGLEKLKGAA